MDKKQIVHIIVELVVILGLNIKLSRRCNELKSEVETMEERMDKLEEVIMNQDQIIKIIGSRMGIFPPPQLMRREPPQPPPQPVSNNNSGNELSGLLGPLMGMMTMASSMPASEPNTSKAKVVEITDGNDDDLAEDLAEIKKSSTATEKKE